MQHRRSATFLSNPARGIMHYTTVHLHILHLCSVAGTSLAGLEGAFGALSCVVAVRVCAMQ